MGDQLPRPVTEEQTYSPETDSHIQLGYNSVADTFEKTVQFRVSADTVEQKPLAREEVAWLRARGGDLLNMIANAPAENEGLVEDRVVGFMKTEAKSFAHTKTGEIVLPTVKDLTEVEQEVVMARALIESVRETERVGEEATIANLREELKLAQDRALELETAQTDLARARAQIDALNAIVTPDMFIQAQEMRDRDEKIKALQVQNDVLRSRADRPRRTLTLNAGFTRIATLGLRGNA